MYGKQHESVVQFENAWSNNFRFFQGDVKRQLRPSQGLSTQTRTSRAFDRCVLLLTCRMIVREKMLDYCGNIETIRKRLRLAQQRPQRHSIGFGATPILILQRISGLNSSSNLSSGISLLVSLRWELIDRENKGMTGQRLFLFPHEAKRDIDHVPVFGRKIRCSICQVLRLNAPQAVIIKGLRAKISATVFLGHLVANVFHRRQLLAKLQSPEGQQHHPPAYFCTRTTNPRSETPRAQGFNWRWGRQSASEDVWPDCEILALLPSDLGRQLSVACLRSSGFSAPKGILFGMPFTASCQALNGQIPNQAVSEKFRPYHSAPARSRQHQIAPPAVRVRNLGSDSIAFLSDPWVRFYQVNQQILSFRK